MMPWIGIIRIILTGILLVMVYRETGIFTAIAMGLCVVVFEIRALTELVVKKEDSP